MCVCVCARVCVMEGDQIRARPVCGSVAAVRSAGVRTSLYTIHMYPPGKKAVRRKHALRERREFGFQLPHFSIAPKPNLPQSSE